MRPRARSTSPAHCAVPHGLSTKKAGWIRRSRANRHAILKGRRGPAPKSRQVLGLQTAARGKPKPRHQPKGLL